MEGGSHRQGYQSGDRQKKGLNEGSCSIAGEERTEPKTFLR